jgi:hypothetical protein
MLERAINRAAHQQILALVGRCNSEFGYCQGQAAPDRCASAKMNPPDATGYITVKDAEFWSKPGPRDPHPCVAEFKSAAIGLLELKFLNAGQPAVFRTVGEDEAFTLLLFHANKRLLEQQH